MSLLVGEEFINAATGLLYAVVAAVSFTFSYLVVSLLLTLNDKMGVGVLFATAALQIILMASFPATSFLDLLEIKFICQLISAALVFAIAIHRLRVAGLGLTSNKS